MSQTARYSIACPRCGAVRTVELYESINVQENPELRDALMANEINMVSCDCGHRFRVDKTLLYHDPAHGFMILLRPTAIELAEEAEREFRRILEQLARQPGLPEAPALHLVLDRIELVERIFLLETGLDERIIEYIKHMLYTRNWKRLDPWHKRLLFDAQDSNETHLVFVVQDLGTRQLEMAIQYPREAYTALCEAFDDDQGTPHLYEFFPGPYISARRLLLEMSAEDDTGDGEPEASEPVDPANRRTRGGPARNPEGASTNDEGPGGAPESTGVPEVRP